MCLYVLLSVCLYAYFGRKARWFAQLFLEVVEEVLQSQKMPKNNFDRSRGSC